MLVPLALRFSAPLRVVKQTLPAGGRGNPNRKEAVSTLACVSVFAFIPSLITLYRVLFLYITFVYILSNQKVI